MRDYSRTELTDTIEEWILNERHRQILKRRLIDGICYEPLAEEFDMSVTQIKRIVYRGQETVFRHLK
jgi:DNA-directed RNA polymerase specialized sigma24 family protein